MRSLLIQVLLLFLVSEEVEVAKRSPLEVGLVTNLFTGKSHLGNGTHSEKIEGAHGAYKWIPGHVHQHSFIPAHLHHIYVPVFPRTVFVHPDVYRQHLGGFGIGADMGGHGAGHGFHVVFNF